MCHPATESALSLLMPNVIAAAARPKTTCLRPDRQTFLPVAKVIVEPIKNSPAALTPTLRKMAFIPLANMNGKTGMIGLMARVLIPALLMAESAIKNCAIPRTYRLRLARFL
jgi:hypothetical protein